jgi:NADH-quinone oxidoreductase subunit M
MILIYLIAILIVGGLLAWSAGRWSNLWPRYIALALLGVDLILSFGIWIQNASQVKLLPTQAPRAWITEVNWTWVPQLGIHFHLALDGLSLLLVVLSILLGIASVLASWKEIDEGVGFFHFNLMWILAGILGVFLSVDLFLFYFSWELMLIPMYFLISIWGHERRVYAAVKFFIFTQASGLLMLLGILALYFIHHRLTGVYSFEYADLLGTPLSAKVGLPIMLAFFVAFAVKLPVVPLHTWLPDAHTQAPTAGSIILAGLLLKTGAYGMLRFVVPLFPEAAHQFAPIAMGLGVAGILYGAVLALGQSDLKRLVAYTSVSHLGFVLLGIFAWNDWALEGALMVMICHGISTGAMFVIVGQIQERSHTREIGRLGGLWASIPRLSGAGLFFAAASMGLPGLGDFVGEFLVLIGTYQQHIVLAVLAAVGILTSTFYGLRFVQGAFHGPNTHRWKLPDLDPREASLVIPMAAILLWLGLYPQPALNTFKPAMQRLEEYAAGNSAVRAQASDSARNQPPTGPRTPQEMHHER